MTAGGGPPPRTKPVAKTPRRMVPDHPRRLAVVTAALLVIGGCAAAPSGSHQRPAPPTDAAPAAALAALEPSFHDLATAIPATTGLAVAPVGTDTALSFGTWSTGVAWSTIKAPLAIAALRADRAGATPLVAKAITQSDNAASEQLWSGLGPPDRAARRVQAVLREGDDADTIVESRRLRPEFTAFGQTRWSLQQQARFAAHLPCIADAGFVVDAMQRLIDEQRWGLAADGAAKGGWGPDRSGRYLVRQFGIVSTPAGRVGVALAAEPHDGTFDTGVAAVTEMARWLTANGSDLPGGSCSPTR